MTPPRSAFSRSISVEIGVHIAVVIAIYIPILVILFPAALLLTGSVIVSSFLPDSSLSLWLTSESLAPLAVSIGITILIALTSPFFQRPKTTETAAALMPVTGPDGETLQNIVSQMWAKISDRQGLRITWFPAFDIAGYASMHAGAPELQVSAGLWRAAVSGEKTAKAILAHELAHLRNKDPRTLRLLDGIRTAAARVLSFTALISLIIYCVIFASEMSTAFAQGGPAGMVFRSILLLLGGGMVFVVFPLSWLALRRHIGFIHSLMEIRADIDAALWTQGRENFTQAFATSKSVRRSGRRELVTALLSRRLTHIPERERLEILTSPALLVTPKVQFFALSILLAMALPLNFASGLFLNGALNHLVAQSAAIAFNVALIGSLSAGQMDGRVHIPARRIFGLALVSILVTALPRINLEPISYLVMSWTLGFGGAPMDVSTWSESVLITVQDLSGKVSDALFNWETALALGVATVALKGFAVLSEQPSALSTKVRIGSVILAAMIGSFLAGFDPFRAIAPAFVPELVEWLDSHGIAYSILLLAPISLALLVDALFVGMRRVAGY